MFRILPSRFVDHLKRDANCNTGATRKPTVVQVIPAIEVIDVNIICFVPIDSPVFWIRIDAVEPIATELEAWKPAHHQEGEAVDAEPVIPAIVVPEIVVWNAVAPVAAALLPSAVLGLPSVGAMLLPGTLLLPLPDTLLLWRAA